MSNAAQQQYPERIVEINSQSNPDEVLYLAMVDSSGKARIGLYPGYHGGVPEEFLNDRLLTAWIPSGIEGRTSPMVEINDAVRASHRMTDNQLAMELNSLAFGAGDPRLPRTDLVARYCAARLAYVFGRVGIADSKGMSACLPKWTCALDPAHSQQGPVASYPAPRWTVGDTEGRELPVYAISARVRSRLEENPGFPGIRAVSTGRVEGKALDGVTAGHEWICQVDSAGIIRWSNETDPAMPAGNLGTYDLLRIVYDPPFIYNGQVLV